MLLPLQLSSKLHRWCWRRKLWNLSFVYTLIGLLQLYMHLWQVMESIMDINVVHLHYSSSCQRICKFICYECVIKRIHCVHIMKKKKVLKYKMQLSRLKCSESVFHWFWVAWRRNFHSTCNICFRIWFCIAWTFCVPLFRIIYGKCCIQLPWKEDAEHSLFSMVGG